MRDQTDLNASVTCEEPPHGLPVFGILSRTRVGPFAFVSSRFSHDLLVWLQTFDLLDPFCVLSLVRTMTMDAARGCAGLPRVPAEAPAGTSTKRAQNRRYHAWSIFSLGVAMHSHPHQSNGDGRSISSLGVAKPFALPPLSI